MSDAVDSWIAHVEVGAGHIDLGPDDVFSLLIFPRAHLLKHIQILIDRPRPVGGFSSGLSEGASVLAHLLGRQALDVGVAGLDEGSGTVVQQAERVRCLTNLADPGTVVLLGGSTPFGCERFRPGLDPSDILENGVNVLLPLLRWGKSGIQVNNT